MPCSPLASWRDTLPEPEPQPGASDSRVAPSALPINRHWEPALSQLRALPRTELDRLVRDWLLRLGLPPVRSVVVGSGPATYHGLLPESPIPVSLRVRVYQRKSRLQAHHVEAFAGHLLRVGAAAGLLVTTGEFTREALVLADAYRTPRLRLYTGSQWTADLAKQRLGVKRAALWRWVLERSPRSAPRDSLDENGGER